MPEKRKVILYIAMSVDGFIAKENGDIDYLSIVEQDKEDYGYDNFIQTVDTVILGRKTYDKVLSFGIGFPHKDKQCFVITRSPRPAIDNIIFYSNSLRELIEKLKKEKGKNIFVDGGSEIVNELMRQDLIDEFIISIIPVFLGSGIPLFKAGRPERKLKLLSSANFEKGLVQLHYVKVDA